MEKNEISISSNPNVMYITKTNFLASEDGELKQIDEIEVFKRYHGEKQFWKIWLTDFLVALDLINNSKQMDVVFHILENTSASNNTYIGTYRKTAQDAKVSYQTVAIIFQKMIDAKIITKVQNGVYKVNPQLVMKGDRQKQKRLVIQYQDAERENKNKKALP